MKNRLYLLSFLLGCLYLSCVEKTPYLDENFIDGQWTAPDTFPLDFELTIVYEDGFISGNYCSMTKNASRIDCPEEDLDCGFLIPIEDKPTQYTGSIKNCRSGESGQLTLTRQNQNLVWELHNMPR